MWVVVVGCRLVLVLEGQLGTGAGAERVRNPQRTPWVTERGRQRLRWRVPLRDTAEGADVGSDAGL